MDLATQEIALREPRGLRRVNNTSPRHFVFGARLEKPEISKGKEVQVGLRRVLDFCPGSRTCRVQGIDATPSSRVFGQGVRLRPSDALMDFDAVSSEVKAELCCEARFLSTNCGAPRRLDGSASCNPILQEHALPLWN